MPAHLYHKGGWNLTSYWFDVLFCFFFQWKRKQTIVYITCVCKLKSNKKMNICIRLKKKKKNITKILSSDWFPLLSSSEGECLNFLSVIPSLCFMVSPCEYLTVNHIVFTLACFGLYVTIIIVSVFFYDLLFFSLCSWDSSVLKHGLYFIHSPICLRELHGIPL